MNSNTTATQSSADLYYKVVMLKPASRSSLAIVERVSGVGNLVLQPSPISPGRGGLIRSVRLSTTSSFGHACDNQLPHSGPGVGANCCRWTQQEQQLQLDPQ